MVVYGSGSIKRYRWTMSHKKHEKKLEKPWTGKNPQGHKISANILPSPWTTRPSSWQFLPEMWAYMRVRRVDRLLTNSAETNLWNFATICYSGQQWSRVDFQILLWRVRVSIARVRLWQCTQGASQRSPQTDCFPRERTRTRWSLHSRCTWWTITTFLIHSANPQSRPVVIIVVRPSV